MKLAVSPQHKGRVICACDLCGTRFLSWITKDQRYCSLDCYRRAVRLQYDITGQTFGHLTVVGRDMTRQTGAGRRSFWLCHCTCGQTKSIMRQSLVGGSSTSCGCQNVARFIERNRTHNKTHVPEYGHWKHMKDRCTNENHREFHRYGGRGIKVCERWNDFGCFFADMGPRPGPQYSLDRYPQQDGDYEPGNVRWATTEQQHNNKRICHYFTYEGRTLTIAQWARAVGIHKGTLRHRLLVRGWPPERALTTPPNPALSSRHRRRA